MQHHVGLGTVQEGLIRGEGRAHGVGITDTGHGIRVLEHVGNLEVGDAVEGGTVVPFGRHVVPVAHIAPAGLLIAPDVLGISYFRKGKIGVVGILGNAGIAEVVAECGVAGEHEEVGRILGLYELIASYIPVSLQLADRLPVAKRRGGLGAHTLGGSFHSLVPLLGVEIEAGGKSPGSAGVEVVLGNLIVAVANILEAQFQVSLDLFINLGHSATLVLGVQFQFNFFHVGNTQVLGAGLGVIVEAEFIHQHKVVVGTDEEGFGHLCTVTGSHDGVGFSNGRSSSEIIDSVQCLVGMGDTQIGLSPEIGGAVVGLFRHI